MPDIWNAEPGFVAWLLPICGARTYRSSHRVKVWCFEGISMNRATESTFPNEYNPLSLHR